MGTRYHGCLCLDCMDEHGWGHPEDPGPPAFMIEMEHMDKEELLEHIQETECPHCGSDNWELTDYSII